MGLNRHPIHAANSNHGVNRHPIDTGVSAARNYIVAIQFTFHQASLKTNRDSSRKSILSILQVNQPTLT